MKSYLAAVLFVVVGAFVAPALAADPVDLRDKEGVVDPKDLKKDDPKETPVNTKEPPPPESKPDVPPFDVDVSGQDTKNYPPPEHLMEDGKGK